MSLTPAKTDLEYANEKLRRAKDPDSFGIGNGKEAELFRKQNEEEQKKAAAAARAAADEETKNAKK